MQVIALLAVLPHYPEIGLGIGVGDPGAPVRVIEFMDYQCPYCQAFSAQVFPYVEPLIEQGKVYWIFADLPLVSVHPYALIASRVSVCAGIQTRTDFLSFHKSMMQEVPRWTSSTDPMSAAVHIAVKAGANPEMLEECLATGRADGFIKATVDLARSLGISGTPAFWINGTVVEGFMGVDEFFRVYRMIGPVADTDK